MNLMDSTTNDNSAPTLKDTKCYFLIGAEGSVENSRPPTLGACIFTIILR